MKENVQIKATAMKGLNDISMKGEIVIFGSTYMANFPFYELINKCKLENAVYNRSIDGMTLGEASEVLQDCVIELKPCKIFLALGEEDSEIPNAIDQYNKIVRKLRSELPSTQIYLICLTEESDYAKKFNDNILSLCDNKRIKYIKFMAAKIPDAALLKARFKQLSCFFRNKPLSMADAFAIAEL